MAKQKQKSKHSATETKHKAKGTPDALFRHYFRDVEMAGAFIIRFGSLELLAAIDLDTLEIFESAYVDARFKNSFADVVFRCKSRNKKRRYYFTILFEHKSKQPTYPHLQLLDYFQHIWVLNRKAKEKPSFILPFIIYHGEKPWRYKQMKDYFPGLPADFWRFLPSFDYVLVDLNLLKMDDLLGISDKTLLRNIFIALKFAHDPAGLIQHLREIVRISASQRSDTFPEQMLQTLFAFVIQRVPQDKTSSAEDTFLETFNDHTMHSLYDQIFLEAEQRAAPVIAELRATAAAEAKIAAEAKATAAEAKATAAEAINKMIKACPDWPDEKIADILSANIEQVSKARKALKRSKK